MAYHGHHEHRRRAGGQRRHHEQDGQQRVVPQRVGLAHAEQAAGVNGHAQGEHHADDLKPVRDGALQAIQHERGDGNHHEQAEEHHAPHHDGTGIHEQVEEAERIVQARLGVHHEHEAHGNGHRCDDAAHLLHRGGIGMTPAQERRGYERARAQAGKEQVPCDDGSPNGFVRHRYHLT